jgi:hypothetical protein
MVSFFRCRQVLPRELAILYSIGYTFTCFRAVQAGKIIGFKCGVFTENGKEGLKDVGKK